MKKALLLLVLVALAAVAAFWHFAPRRCPKPELAYLETLASEISSEGEFGTWPVIDPAASEMAFPRTAKGGRALFLLNLKTGAMRRFQHDHEVYRVYGYSPDGKYLLFCDHWRQNRLMALSRTNSLRGPYVEGEFANVAWVGSNSICFVNPATNTAQLIKMDSPDAARNAFKLESRVLGMVASGPAVVTLLDQSGIWSLALETGERQALLTRSNELVSGWNQEYYPQWLAFSPEKKEYLFCSWDRSNFRHLYRLAQEHNGWQTVQASGADEHTYNGQWVQGGKGWAYIGNRTNHFYLAVRAAKAVDSTNLFVGGHVFGYTVSRDGNTIYAIASAGPEPLGAWEYGIAQHELRFVGARAKMSLPAVVPRQEHWVKSFDGVRVPYYLCAPRDLRAKVKYPAILAAPPQASQHFPAWEMFSQFFANIGVYTIGVNHRGLDGYGKAYKELRSDLAHQDLQAVYREIAKNPSIDKRRVFLMGYSAGTSAIARTIEEHPGHWAGVIDISGATPPEKAVQEQRLKVFLFSGDADFPQLREAVASFEKWAIANNIPVHVMHGSHTWHIISDTEIDRQMFLELAGFIFDR